MTGLGFCVGFVELGQVLLWIAVAALFVHWVVDGE